MPALDVVVLTLLALGAARGLGIGLVREAFSIAGVGAAVFAVWHFGGAAADALAPHLGHALPSAAVHAIGVAGLALCTLVAVAVVGRIIRRSLRFAGLGLVDRLAGACLGALEAALVAALLLAGGSLLLGRDHPWLAQSQAAAVFERLRAGLAPGEAAAPGVAAPAARATR